MQPCGTEWLYKADLFCLGVKTNIELSYWHSLTKKVRRHLVFNKMIEFKENMLRKLHVLMLGYFQSACAYAVYHLFQQNIVEFSIDFRKNHKQMVPRQMVHRYISCNAFLSDSNEEVLRCATGIGDVRLRSC